MILGKMFTAIRAFFNGIANAMWEREALRALAERIARERSWPVHIAQHLEQVALDLG